MRVPAHLQEISKALALRSWVQAKSFPTEVYFETIDRAKGLLDRHAGTDEAGTENGAPDELVVSVVAAALDAEGLLLTHVLNTGTYALDTEDREMRWLHACQAAAWVVLQAYASSCRAGRWPRG